MPKLKTRRAAAKRFNTTGTGKIKRMKPYKSHILESKSPKRKRNLRKSYARFQDHDRSRPQDVPVHLIA